MHRVRLCCENSEYPDIPAFSRLAGLAPQHPKLRTYFFVNPKQQLCRAIERSYLLSTMDRGCCQISFVDHRRLALTPVLTEVAKRLMF
jgi:hypothetical protein